MENKAHALAAGIFVMLVAAMLAALAIWLTRETGGQGHYEIATRQAVTGLQPQAAVRYRGVKVGKVADIDLDPINPGQVLVRLDIDADTPVTRSTFATLGYQGLTGIAYVQLDDGGESREPLRAEGKGVARIPLRPGLLDQWTTQGERMLGQLEATIQRVNQVMSADNVKAMRETLSAMPELTRQTTQTMEVVREAAVSVRAGADRVRDAAERYDRLAQQLQRPGGTIERLDHAAGALANVGQSGEGSSLGRLNRTLDDTGRAARQLNRTAQTLETNPQALLYGPWQYPPGPGEAGFVAPAPAQLPQK